MSFLYFNYLFAYYFQATLLYLLHFKSLEKINLALYTEILLQIN